jgi:hypothetical protein
MVTQQPEERNDSIHGEPTATKEPEANVSTVEVVAPSKTSTSSSSIDKDTLERLPQPRKVINTREVPTRKWKDRPSLWHDLQPRVSKAATMTSSSADAELNLIPDGGNPCLKAPALSGGN